MEQIARRYRKAKKCYTCELCGYTIEVGEKYSYQVNKDGNDFWDFKSHLECEFLCNELWEFIDPWDGMYEDDFLDGVQDFCVRMICPNCPSYDNEHKECRNDQCYCMDKCVEKLKEYDFTLVKCDLPEAIGRRCWGFVKKENPVKELPRYVG